MTLIISVQTKESIWLVADRRLSAPGRLPINDAIKATIVEVTDGIALIGYAGLGATAKGSQPSEWVSNVLRGRHHPLEEMLQVVANAMQREFIPHMDGVRDTRLRQHSFIIPSFLNGNHRIYTIDMAHINGGYKFRYTRHIMEEALPLQITVPVALSGSGGSTLSRLKDWKRTLLRLVKAYNKGKINEQGMAKNLANLAYRCYLLTKDGTVGPDCLVVWRNNTKFLNKGGGGHAFFSSGNRCSDTPSIPYIDRGMDLKAVLGILLEKTKDDMFNALDAFERGEEIIERDKDEFYKEMNDDLSKLPSKPNENLR